MPLTRPAPVAAEEALRPAPGAPGAAVTDVPGNSATLTEKEAPLPPKMAEKQIQLLQPLAG